MSYRVNYVAYYLAYILIISLIFSISIDNLLNYPLFFFAAIIVGYFLFIALYRPYQDRVHNIGLIINQTGILFNLAWLVSQDYFYLTRLTD